MGNLLCCVLVKQSDVAIKERFGKFQKVLNPGLQFVPWVIGDYVAGHLTLRLQQLDVQCETKTKDNVFVTVVASIQYRVLVDKASDAFYRLSNPTSQIKAYVFDAELGRCVRAKNENSQIRGRRARQAMTAYGYEILQTLIIDIEPDQTAARMRVAANEKAEAEKIIQIKREKEKLSPSTFLDSVSLVRDKLSWTV
ncbi:Hypersensitive-induced response protein 3 [Raphanus sativus]|nr:Hypersensitive-induced response protein 3 [Raphanus sativus]